MAENTKTKPSFFGELCDHLEDEFWKRWLCICGSAWTAVSEYACVSVVKYTVGMLWWACSCKPLCKALAFSIPEPSFSLCPHTTLSSNYFSCMLLKSCLPKQWKTQIKQQKWRLSIPTTTSISVCPTCGLILFNFTFTSLLRIFIKIHESQATNCLMQRSSTPIIKSFYLMSNQNVIIFKPLF